MESPVVKLSEAANILGISTRAAESALRNAGIKSGYPRDAVERLRDSRPGQGARTDLADRSERIDNRNNQRRMSYARRNPVVAWPIVQSELTDYSARRSHPIGDETAIRTVADDVVVRWVADRPDSSLMEYTWRYAKAVAADHDPRFAELWREHIAALPVDREPVKPRDDTPKRPVGRLTCHGLLKIHQQPVAWTEQMCGLVGPHIVATLSDHGLIGARPGTPWIIQLTERGHQVVDLLEEAKFLSDTVGKWPVVAEAIKSMGIR